MMSTPRYEFLTQSYVDALGLDPMPVRMPRSSAMGTREGDCLPPAGQSPIKEGVAFEGFVYVRDSPYSFRLTRTVRGRHQ